MKYGDDRLILRSSAVADPFLGVILVCVGIIGGIFFGRILGYDEFDFVGLIVVPTVLCLVTAPFIRSIESRRGSGLANIVSLALVIKMISAYFGFLISNYYYDATDGLGYQSRGVAIANQYLAGDRSAWSLLPTNFGTRFIDEINGIVALIVGQSYLASYMVFSWLGFLGLWAFVDAVWRAVPQVEIRRYAMILLFLPSGLFWTSILGKDPWMVFGLGLIATGAARLFRSQFSGLFYLSCGVIATGMVRPHVTALALISFLLAYLIAGGRQKSAKSPALTILSILTFGLAVALSSGPIEAVLPNSDGGINQVLETTSDRSSYGGSEVEVTIPNSPLEYPQAFFTVMFRPTVFEVQTVTQLLTAIESAVLLLAITTIWRRRVLSALANIHKSPFLRLAILYTLAFAFAWSSIGNLGIIARQRVQVLPFLLILLCWMPTGARHTSLSSSSNPEERDNAVAGAL